MHRTVIFCVSVHLSMRNFGIVSSGQGVPRPYTSQWGGRDNAGVVRPHKSWIGTYLLCCVLLLAVTLVGCAESSSPQPQAQSAATNTALPPTATPTLSAAEMTFILGATQTGVAGMTNPAPPATLVQAQVIPSCTPGQFTAFDGTASQRIQAVVQEASIKDTFVSVNKTQRSADCANFELLDVVFTVDFTVGTLTNTGIMGDLAADTLNVLANFDTEITAGAGRVILNLNYDERESDQQQSITAIPYAQAKEAVASGLRGAALMTRLRELGTVS